MITRFAGTIEEFADVDVREFADWLQSLPLEDWSKLADAGWQGYGHKYGRPIANDLTGRNFPGCYVSGVGIFVLAAGQVHPAHKDVQPHNWITRVHVPLVTNNLVTATMDDGEHRMDVGKAYKFNTLATHAVANGGTMPRAHLVFDILKMVRI